MSVPDTQKKIIWQQIQEKINAIGVSHRTLEEIRKRWYDIRSGTKEKVAERLREVRGTGGGPSTVPPPIAMEAMVEQTLEPEAVIGMGEVDSPAPGTSKSEYLEICCDTHKCSIHTLPVHSSRHHQTSSVPV
ncbi:hypothetical protein NDU88_003524 [Pleurodeles waltl]|uniref:Myb/SANT-like DNA-binding domain-containing protein n=1 Tax=Pleurodeles waltl TaxID=8319 RepID=A0AAV7NGM6_PLEWA|nr:hypothetical protein NDU88_003524 [Pleurodeles waltl]